MPLICLVSLSMEFGFSFIQQRLSYAVKKGLVCMAFAFSIDYGISSEFSMDVSID